MKKLIAALACRNKGSRLFGKPFQNLDINSGITILDNIIGCLENISAVDEVVLGIAEGVENDVFVQYASNKGIRYIRGDEEDVLLRLIHCGDVCNASDILRTTSESPFPYFDLIELAWEQHTTQSNDATFLDNIIDGCGFEILSLDALKKSHLDGQDRHRSELCTLYIRENRDIFKIGYIVPPSKLVRKDIRLTVDYPEDLVICRAVYERFKSSSPNIPLLDVVDFLDRNKQLLELISPFCEEGYKTMYL